MSKSKRNTIDPEPILAKYGADAVRWFMLSDSPPERDLEWSEGGIEGAARFVQRVWRLASGDAVTATGEDEALRAQAPSDDRRGRRSDRRASVQQGGGPALRARQRDREGPPSATRDEAFGRLVQLIAPMAPHLAEEAWAQRAATA